MSFRSPAAISPTPVGIIAHATTIIQPIRRAETTSVPPNLIGYTSSGGKWVTESCRESSAWQTFSTYGRCCLTARPDCFVATGCSKGSIMLGDGGFASTCTGSAAQTSCITGTVFHYIGDLEPIMNYQCWPEWDGGSWDATVATTTLTPSSTSNSAHSTAVSTSLSSSPTPSSSETSAAPSTSTTSKAWIAGPVFGGILGAVLFTLLGVFLYRRRAKKEYQRQQDGLLAAAAYHPNNQGRADVYAYDGVYAGERTKSGELQGGSVEMDARGVYEADGGRGILEADGRKLPVEADGREVR